MAGFMGGYGAAWALYSVVAAEVQLQIQSAGASNLLAGIAPRVGAGILLMAGLYQWLPVKSACLAHCRSPLTYFLAHWRNGPTGGWRMGFAHGLFCVGCCWALMLTALSVGTMNPLWMAVVAVVAIVEQTIPGGQLLRLPLGMALIGAGVLRVL